MGQAKQSKVDIIIKAVDKVSPVTSRILSAFRTIELGALKAGQRIRAALSERIGGAIKGIVDQVRTFGALAIAGGAAAGFYKIAEGVIGATVEMQRFKAQLNGVFDGEKGGAAALNWAKKFEQKAPFAINTVIDSMIRLKAYGIDPMKGALEVVGNYSAMFGRNLQDGVEATADALMGEWERMKAFGLKREMLEKWGKTHGFAGIFDNQGTIVNMAKFQLALFTYMQTKAKGSMSRMMETLEGRWSNLKTKIWTALSALGGLLAPTLGRILNTVTVLVGDMFSEKKINGAKGFIDKMFSRDNIKSFVTGLANMYVIIKNVGDIFIKVVKLIQTGVAYAVKYIITGFQYAVNAVIDVFNMLVNKIDFKGKFADWIKPLLTIMSKFGAFINPAMATAADASLSYLNSHTNKDKAINHVDWSNAANTAFNAIKNPTATLSSLFGDKAYTQEAQGIVDKIMGAYDKAGQKDKADLSNPLLGIQKDVGKIVQQNAEVLTKIYGGGPQLQWQSRRFAFGGMGAGGRIPQNYVVNLKGGSPEAQAGADAATVAFFQHVLKKTPKVVRRS